MLRTAQGLDIKGLSEEGGQDGGVNEPPPQQNHNHIPRPDIQLKPAMKRQSPIQTSVIENSTDQNLRKKPRIVAPVTMELPPILEQAPVIHPTSHQVQDIQPEMVKREMTPVTIDLDGSDQGGSMSGFEGLSQEMAFIDTSVATSFDGEVTYEEGQYYEEAMGHVAVADERVSD